MADLIYMTKAAWTAITDTVRGKTGKTGLLKSTDIPYALSDLIGTGALFDGKGVKKISNDTIKRIRSNCCYNFTDLEEIAIPAVTAIEDYAFSYCTSLKKINNMQNLRNIGQFAFAFGPNLTNVSLPKAGSIGDFAFKWREPYQSSKGIGFSGKLTLGNITSIGQEAFRYTGFSEVDITVCPGYIGATIDVQAFSDCSNLTKVTIHGTDMLALSDAYEFWNSPIDSLNGKIYVEASMVDVYKTATNWSNYASIIEAIL